MPFVRVEGLTQPQAEILLHVIRHVEEHGFQPSLTEMAETFGITVKATRDRLLQVAQKGYIEFPAKKQERCFRLKGVRFTATVSDEVPAPAEPGTVPYARSDSVHQVVSGALAEFFHSTDNEPATAADMEAWTGVAAPQLYEFLAYDEKNDRLFERVGKSGKAARWRMTSNSDDK